MDNENVKKRGKGKKITKMGVLSAKNNSLPPQINIGLYLGN